MNIIASHLEGSEKTIEEVIPDNQNKPKDERLLADTAAEVSLLTEHLDEVEERNTQTINLMGDIDLATESRDLTQDELNVLRASLHTLAGGKRRPTYLAQESSDGISRRTVALEGIKDTLKKFWEYIKTVFNKLWVTIKSWYINCFDISKRVLKRAKKIQEQADNEYGSQSENTIEFSEVSKLAVNGKYNDPSDILRALKNLEEIVFEFINDNNSEHFTDTVDELTDATSDAITKINTLGKETLRLGRVSDENFRVSRDLLVLPVSIVNSIKAGVDKVYTANTSDLVSDKTFKIENVDKYLRQYGETSGSGKDTFTHSDVLPGDKWILSVKSTPPSTVVNGCAAISDIIDSIRRTRLVVTTCRYNERHYDTNTEIKTLSASAVARGCDSVVNMCDYIFDYRKEFDKRDRFKSRVFKEIDRVVKEVSDSDDNGLIEVDRVVRSFGNAISGFIRKRSDFEATLCTYAVTTSIAFLNYSERSLAVYSK